MNINTLLGFLTPLILLFIGVMLKFSHNDGWSTYKKYWLYFIIGGLLLLILKICKYWLL
jgi:hypothetical protein